MSEKKIVVLGAGVAGLTSALLLSKNPKYMITVAAKHMPGDYDIEYASPWAGANYMPVSVKGTDAAEWDKNTWPPLQDLAQNHPEAGVHFQRTEIYNRKKDVGSDTAKWFADLLSSNPWWKNVVPNFRIVPQSELKTSIDNATTFTSVCINTAIYLPWLVGQCLAAGVVFRRAIVRHVSEAARLHHSEQRADLIINCTGLSSAKLGGVEDKFLMPARGQIVVVRNDPGAMFSISGCDDGQDEVAYIMMRAAGEVDPNLAIRIMKRAVELCPKLTDGRGIEHLDIIRHGVGLRPLREGGARVEKEKIGGVLVVHNYGHGGAGYQSSYGCSQEVVRLVDEAFRERPRL